MENLMLSTDRSLGERVYRKVADAKQYIRDNVKKKSFIPKAIGALFTFVIAILSLILLSFNNINILVGLRVALTDLFILCENVFYFLFTKGATDLFGSTFVDFFILIASFLTAVMVVSALQDDCVEMHSSAEYSEDRSFASAPQLEAKGNRRLFVVYSVFRN